MPPKKIPEVIDLLSSSPEPERVPKPTRISTAKPRIKENRNSPVRNNESRGSGKFGGGVDKVLEPSRMGGNAQAASASVRKEWGHDGSLKEVGKTIVKEREITEAEKIRELRLKRFGGFSQRSSVPGSQLGNERVEEETVEVRHVVVSEAAKNVRGGGMDWKESEKQVRKSVPSLHDGGGVVMSEFGSGQDYWDGIDLTQDGDDDLGGFDSPWDKSKQHDGSKSSALEETGMSHGFKDRKSGDVNFSDPFRLSSPVAMAKDSKNRLNQSTVGSKTRIEVDSTRKPGKKDKGTGNTDFSDPFRSSSPFEVVDDFKVQPNKSASGSKPRFEEEFSIMDDKFGTPVDFDESYDIEAPVAKRQRVSPTSRNGSMTSSIGPRAMTKETGGYRRTVSALAQSSHHDFKSKTSGLKRSRTMDSDPIAFTSSPDPFDYKIKKAEKRKERADDDDFVDIDDIPKKGTSSVSARHGAEGSAARSKSKAKDLDTIHSDGSISEDSEASLPDIHNIPAYKSTTKKSTNKSRDGGTSAVPSPSHPKPKAKPKSSKSALEAYEKEKAAEKRAQEKAKKAAENIAAKEAEKERKRVGKENKAIGKEREAAIAKVNVSRTDKKVSRCEMIVDFPRGMDARLTEHTKVHLGSVEVDAAEWDSPIPDVIRWRRKVDGEWDDEEGCWMPVKPFVKKEKYVLVVVKGEEFVELIRGEEGRDLVCHVLKMKGRFEDVADKSGGAKNIIYLIEGLNSFLKKHRNAKNRKFAEEVRNRLEAVRKQVEEMDGDDGGSGSSIASTNARNKRKGKGKEKESEVQEIDEEAVEEALLSLQVLHGVLVHHTGSLAETAQWITAFTQHIATAPYRHAQDLLSQNFCMKSGQVKSGTSPSDTFIKMLQETNRLTAPIAHSIAAEYPSATSLIDGFETADRKEERLKRDVADDGSNGAGVVLREKDRASCLLMGLRKDNRADGAVSDRAVGPMLSKRLYKVFMGRDAGSMDV